MSIGSNQQGCHADAGPMQISTDLMQARQSLHAQAVFSAVSSLITWHPLVMRGRPRSITYDKRGLLSSLVRFLLQPPASPSPSFPASKSSLENSSIVGIFITLYVYQSLLTMRTVLSFLRLLIVPTSSSAEMACCIPFRTLLQHKNRYHAQLDNSIDGTKSRDGGKCSGALSLVQTEGIEVVASGVNPTMPVDPRFPEMLMQPDARPISKEQLSAEVKSIYAGLVMVESKCIRT
jgi:hypothetical protein